MSPKTLIYENEIHSLFVSGDKGEYELLSYHYPVLGLIKETSLIIDWKESVSVKAGIIRFFANECIVLVEELEKKKPVTV